MKCRFKFSFKSLDKFTDPLVAFVIFLALADEDVIIISFNNA
jgi:hypothetical protein